MAYTYLCTDHFRGIHSKFLDEQKSLHDRLKSLERLKHEIIPEAIKRDTDFIIHQQYGTRWAYVNASRTKIYEMVMSCFDKIDDYLKERCKTPEAFDQQNLVDLANFSEGLLIPPEETKIEIRPEFKVKVIQCIFRFALHQFDKMHNKYEMENDLRRIVEADKESHFDTFHDAVTVSYTHLTLPTNREV